MAETDNQNNQNISNGKLEQSLEKAEINSSASSGGIDVRKKKARVSARLYAGAEGTN